MKLLAITMLICAGSTLAQDNPVTRGLSEGIRMGVTMREQQRLEQQMQMDAERDRQNREYEATMRQLQENRRRDAAKATAQNSANESMDRAIAATAARYPDWELLKPEMTRLFQVMDVRGEHYEEFLECLYLAAKYSRFSQSPNRRAPEGSLENKLQAPTQ